jgi:hypothetical protein
VVHSGKGWGMISQIEEYRLDWSGRRYVVQAVHRRVLILDEPLQLTAAFGEARRTLVLRATTLRRASGPPRSPRPSRDDRLGQRGRAAIVGYRPPRRSPPAIYQEPDPGF